MTPDHDEILALLRRNLELTKENNRLIRKIRRNAIIGRVAQVLIWAAVIGVPIYLYYAFLEPTLIEIIEAYRNVQTGVESGAENFQNMLEKLPFVGDLFKSGNATTTK